MSVAVLDVETDGVDATKVHCAVTVDPEGAIRGFRTPEELQKDLYSLDKTIGHNLIGFDSFVLERLWDTPLAPEKVEDTLVLSRLANPSREGGHSMAAWGERLGVPKVEHEDFTHMTPALLNRCVEDCKLNWRMHQHIERELKGFSEESRNLEHEVQWIIQQQVRNGWLLDQEKCYMLLCDLKDEKEQLEDEVHQRFRPKAKLVREIQPKIKKDGSMSVVGLKFLGEDCLDKVGGPLSRVDFPEFNLGSRKQIGEYLMSFGWKPKEFTETGQPIVSETELEKVEGIPEAALIAKYLTVEKRIAMINSWLDAVGEDGRVHGYVNSCGAVTGRMTHSSPNMAQVVASYSYLGKEMRSCWIAKKTFKIVGMDASGLELRMLAHYMNDPAYTKELLEGDIHTANQKAAGLATRDQAKTFIYAFLYGAGNAKIGEIVGGTAADGARLKEKFLKATPALADLIERVKKASRKGYLVGLDGRKVYVRSEHAALNTLLQSAGAIVMKKALVTLNSTAQHLEFGFVGNIHDEIQSEVLESHTDEFGELAVKAVILAGEHFNMRCPLDAEYKVGNSWAETH